MVHVEGDDDLLPLPRLGERHLAAVVLGLPALEGRQAPRVLLLSGNLLLQEARQLLVACGSAQVLYRVQGSINWLFEDQTNRTRFGLLGLKLR